VIAGVSGRGARAVFAGEAGGHRWQRIAPTEKRGRVQSSTITVAILAEAVIASVEVCDKDLAWSTCRSPGPGGQHVQKTDSAVQLVHLPTGIIIRAHEGKSQHANRQAALDRLRNRLLADRQAAADEARAAARRVQVGSGMRADKRRTVRVQDGTVIDHITGRTWRYRDYVRGEW
jgi:peptide chain release factor 1